MTSLTQNKALKTRLICAVLLLAVLLLMLLPWIKFTDDTVTAGISGLTDLGSMFGLDDDSYGTLAKLIKAMRDGALTPFEVGTVLGGAHAYLEQSFWAPDDSSVALLSAIHIVYSVVLWAAVLALAGTLALFVLGRTNIIGKHGSAVLIAPILALVLAVFQLLVCVWLGAAYEAGPFGILRPTVWFAAALAGTIAALVVWLRQTAADRAQALPLLALVRDGDVQTLSQNAAAGVESGVHALREKSSTLLGQGRQLFNRAAPPVQPWTCPRCGKQLTGEEKFCTNCGASRPEPQVCANCGKLQAPGVKFCADCGAPFVAQRRCPSCGTPFRLNDKFCQNCGHPVGYGAPAAGPAGPAWDMPAPPAQPQETAPTGNGPA